MAVNECRRMKINVLPPDINESNVGFTIVDQKDSLGGRGIRFGLSAIKNVGVAAIDAILSARATGAFTSFADFLGRVDARRVNKKVLESLIKVGALEMYGTRAALLASIDKIREKVAKPKGDDSQQGLFATGELKKTESATVITLENIQEFGEDELQTLERQLLGFSLSARPISETLGPLEFQSTHKIFEISVSDSYPEMVRVAGVVAEVRIIMTKKIGWLLLACFCLGVLYLALRAHIATVQTMHIFRKTETKTPVHHNVLSPSVSPFHGSTPVFAPGTFPLPSDTPPPVGPASRGY